MARSPAEATGLFTRGKGKNGISPQLLAFMRDCIAVHERIGEALQGKQWLAISMDSNTANNRLLAGEPLVGASEFRIDEQLAMAAYREFLNLFRAHRDLFGAFPDALRDLPVEAVVNERHARAWYSGDRVSLPIPLDAAETAVLRSILLCVYKPFIAWMAASLAPVIDQEMWRRSQCPVCGGNPDFSYLAKETAARWLVCSRCDSEWLYRRIGCPYCGNDNQDEIRYFADSQGLYRLYVCEKCHHYLKLVDLRARRSNSSMVVEKLLSVHLDVQASARGYLPCP